MLALNEFPSRSKIFCSETKLLWFIKYLKYIKNECDCFIIGFKHRERNELNDAHEFMLPGVAILTHVYATEFHDAWVT